LEKQAGPASRRARSASRHPPLRGALQHSETVALACRAAPSTRGRACACLRRPRSHV